MQPFAAPASLQAPVMVGPVLGSFIGPSPAGWSQPLLGASPEGWPYLAPRVVIDENQCEGAAACQLDPSMPALKPESAQHESPSPSLCRSKDAHAPPSPKQKGLKQLTSHEERQREKNRLAQHRYRARIKSVMSSLSDELLTLQQEVSSRDKEIYKLELENKRLRQELEQINALKGNKAPERQAAS